MNNTEPTFIEPRVIVIDDDPAVRKAIERLLRSAKLNVLTHASAQSYLEQDDLDMPGCLVLDMSMPGLNGLDLQDALAAREHAPPIIFLTGHATIPESVQAMKHGAVEFLTKPVDESLLLDAVHGAIAKDGVDRLRRAEQASVAQRFAALTAREAEVLAHVVAGKLNKQIAGELGIVEKTIKVHRARVMEKLQVRSLAELVTLATQAGVTVSYNT